MSGHIIPVVPKRVLDFGGVPLGFVQTIILADRVELVHWQELSMMVRVHQHSLSGGTGWISIAAVPCSVTEDDPGTTLVAPANSGPAVLLDSTTGSPDMKTRFMRTMGPNCVGDMVRIVASAQRLLAGSLTATVSVEISAKDGTSFMPTLLTNCIVWLHADDYNPSDGSWPDRSGADNHGFAPRFAPLSAHPTLETNFNGLSDVLFNGTSQYVVVNGLAQFLTGDDKAFTAIYLLELVSLPGAGAAVAVWNAGRSINANPQIESQFSNGPPNIYRTWRRDDAGVFKIQGVAGTIATGAKYSIVDAFDGATMNVTINGSPYIVGADLNVAALTLDQLSIGVNSGGGALVEFANMRLREFAVFKANLSTADIASVVNGMRERAGLVPV